MFNANQIIMAERGDFLHNPAIINIFLV